METRRYWNSYRIGTAIASPVITALFWVAIKGWVGWIQMLYAVLLGILIFFSGWGLVFVISFCRAPVALDAEYQHTIARLKQELELPDKAAADYLADKVKIVGENGQALLKFMLLHDEEVSRAQIKVAGLSYDDIGKSLHVCAEQGLIKTRFEQSGTTWFSVNSYHWIPEGFRAPLKRLLYKTDRQ